MNMKHIKYGGCMYSCSTVRLVQAAAVSEDG